MSIMRISKVVSAKKGEIVVIDEESGNTIKRKGGTVAWRCNNPGNVKNGPFAKSMGSVGQDHIGHAVFKSNDHGIQAQFVLLFNEDSPYWNLTLLDAIKRYAPVGDASNEPTKYQMYITKHTGIPATKKLKNLTHDEKMKMLHYMWIYEGYKEGTNSTVKSSNDK